MIVPGRFVVGIEGEPFHSTDVCLVCAEGPGCYSGEKEKRYDQEGKSEEIDPVQRFNVLSDHEPGLSLLLSCFDISSEPLQIADQCNDFFPGISRSAGLYKVLSYGFRLGFQIIICPLIVSTRIGDPH